MADENGAKRKVRVGVVVSDKMDKTRVVSVEWSQRHPLYRRRVRRRTSFKAHDEMNLTHEGDVVRIIETRPLSKDKRWRIGEILQKGEVVDLKPKEVDQTLIQELEHGPEVAEPAAEVAEVETPAEEPEAAVAEAEAPAEEPVAEPEAAVAEVEAPAEEPVAEPEAAVTEVEAPAEKAKPKRATKAKATTAKATTAKKAPAKKATPKAKDAKPAKPAKPAKKPAAKKTEEPKE